MKTCPVCDTDYPDHQATCDTDGAVLILSQELAPGTFVRGKYRIVRKLGQGGMGVVYLAEDSLLGVKVALKFLAGDLGKDPRFIKRFRTEARAAYQLRHPNIAEVTNLDQAEDGGLFIAMEYIEGRTLRAVLEQNPKGLEISRAIGIVRGVASGLAAAHAQGTIHRDIKPENIMLAMVSEGRAPDGRAAGATERAKVLDFGIAAVAENLTKMTRTQGFLLTYAYAAPEQWQEMPAEQMDGRTDLYALGCVLYEMLTGTPPFHAHTTAGWMKKHCEEAPKPPSTLRPELAHWANLDALLAILLAKDRKSRPHSAVETLNLLATVKPSSALLSPPNTATESTRPRHAITEPLVAKPLSYEPHKRPGFAYEPPLFHSQESKSLWTELSARAWGGVGAVALLVLFGLWWAVTRQSAPEVDQPISTQRTDQAVEPGKRSPVDTHSQQQPQTVPSRSPTTPSQMQPQSKTQPANSSTVPHQIPQFTPQTEPAPVLTTTPATPQPVSTGSEADADSLYSNKRYSEAAPIYEHACAGGNGRACHKFGRMLAYGNGVDLDTSREVAYYRRGCDLGNAESCRDLGSLYQGGIGTIARDLPKAREFFLKACGLGSQVSCGEARDVDR